MGILRNLKKKVKQIVNPYADMTMEEIRAEMEKDMATMMSEEFFVALYSSDLSEAGYKLAFHLGDVLSPDNTVPLNLIRLTEELGLSGNEIITAIQELKKIKVIVYWREQNAYLCNPHFIYTDYGCYSERHAKLCSWWDNMDRTGELQQLEIA